MAINFVAEKKKKDLTWQHALIFIALGLSAASAWKLFMPKRNNGHAQQIQQTNDAAEIAQYMQYLQSLPQVPLNQGTQLPVVATQPYYPNNFQRGPAVSSHFEEMDRTAQLEKIPVQEQLGLNQMFPQVQTQQNPNRNTISQYAIPSAPRQSTHFDRIQTGTGPEDVAKAFSAQPQVLQRQSGYSQQAGYSTNPYTQGNVI